MTSGDIASIDTWFEDRGQFGSNKPAHLMTSFDITNLLQAMYLQTVVGPWHVALAQFVEGTIYTIYS